MRKISLGIVPVLLILAQMACNLPSVSPSTQAEQATTTPTPEILVEAAPATAAPVPPVAPTATPEPAAPQDPLVLRATLCWYGPGQKYEVISSLHQGERVKLLGRGSISGWYIVENPTYHDPCWVQEADLQVDPALDQLSLKIFSPPATKVPPTDVPPSPAP
jgi:uncharacterized protein YgiM (DUF1202 family)